jgi:hypothetical protein
MPGQGTGSNISHGGPEDLHFAVKAFEFPLTTNSIPFAIVSSRTISFREFSLRTLLFDISTMANLEKWSDDQFLKPTGCSSDFITGFKERNSFSSPDSHLKHQRFVCEEQTAWMPRLIALSGDARNHTRINNLIIRLEDSSESPKNLRRASLDGRPKHVPRSPAISRCIESKRSAPASDVPHVTSRSANSERSPSRERIEDSFL